MLRRAADSWCVTLSVRALNLFVLGTLVPFLAEGGAAQADDETSSGRDSVSAAMRRAMEEIAAGVQVERGDGPSRVRVERIESAVYRFNDPARDFSDGTVWGWGPNGRPVALLTLSAESGPDQGRRRWLYEFTSLSQGPVFMRGPEGWAWTPKGAGPTFEGFSRSPDVGPDEAKRARQMKDLARRFAGHEFWTTGPGDDQRYQLRLLPKPVARYSDPKAGVVDGSLFLLAYGTNPEVAILIEAAKSEKGAAAWRYGLARISGAEVHVDVDGQEIVRFPKVLRVGTDDPYSCHYEPIRLPSSSGR